MNKYQKLLKKSTSDHAKTIRVLCNLLEWAKGNRGSKHNDPYSIPEVKAALKHLADIWEFEDYLDVPTDY